MRKAKYYTGVAMATLGMTAFCINAEDMVWIFGIAVALLYTGGRMMERNASEPMDDEA